MRFRHASDTRALAMLCAVLGTQEERFGQFAALRECLVQKCTQAGTRKVRIVFEEDSQVISKDRRLSSIEDEDEQVEQEHSKIEYRGGMVDQREEPQGVLA